MPGVHKVRDRTFQGQIGVWRCGGGRRVTTGLKHASPFFFSIVQEYDHKMYAHGGAGTGYKYYKPEGGARGQDRKKQKQKKATRHKRWIKVRLHHTTCVLGWPW